MTQALGESGAAAGPTPPAGDGLVTTKRRGWGWLLLVPGMLWLLVFFVYPTVQLFFTSLYDPSGSFEQGYALTWHFANYVDAIRDTWDLFVRSFMYAGIATVVCLMLGYPLAYAIAFKAGRWKYVMLVLVIAPFLTSFLLRTLAWRTILSDNGFVTSSLQTIGILPDDGRLLATPVAVVAGLIYNFLPFMTLPLYASLDKVDPRLIEAAGDLYSRPFVGFRKVTFPLSMPGVVSGTLLTFIPACGDYINAELLGTPKQYMVGNRIQAAFLTEHNYPLAASLSIILMLVVVVMVIFYIRRAGTEELI
jgi:spermidine/putrescine transport system permease protein